MRHTISALSDYLPKPQGTVAFIEKPVTYKITLKSGNEIHAAVTFDLVKSYLRAARENAGGDWSRMTIQIDRKDEPVAVIVLGEIAAIVVE